MGVPVPARSFAIRENVNTDGRKRPGGEGKQERTEAEQQRLLFTLRPRSLSRVYVCMRKYRNRF